MKKHRGDQMYLFFLEFILVIFDENAQALQSTLVWKLNPGVRTITLTTIANYTCILHTKEAEYGVEH